MLKFSKNAENQQKCCFASIPVIIRIVDITYMFSYEFELDDKNSLHVTFGCSKLYQYAWSLRSLRSKITNERSCGLQQL